ncbi:MAG: sugar phosphate isomerase/epimerase [Isosphaeraceae bacterium]
MNRTISCFSNCFGAEGVRTAVRRIRDTGIHHLELALRGHNLGGLVIPEEAVVTEKATDAEAQEFVELLHEFDVRVSGCNVGGANILTPEGVALTQRRIRFARRWFGVDVVVSGAGQPANEAERSLMRDGLRAIGDTASECGIVVALETHKGPTQHAQAMLETIAYVDHPSILLNFDTGNIAYYNAGMNAADQLERVKHLVRNVHLKDNRGQPEDWYFPAVGQAGGVDFTRIREILDGVGFAGPYTIEIEGILGEPEPGLEGRVDRVRASVDHLRACGYFD